ncbi:FliA/WhiG family RNA polymerase sigma factor [Oceanobacillus caeni]|uniref:RNA polymerase sigma factor SigD n=1 Tax=Oceanobacillus caeni TaxID=405946 RepID=A0ABR5MLF4_9BACI|nr:MULTISPECIES: FliA/WhiG family RNA polymerase sigma factor [Bacillaceae]KKE78392.1 RNA polymerase sigma factor SigD [Bacilli bacterium VT-13-104]PZD88652.1 FliA/WhiG family RNA polymerase sigma factor [Bacilli bacterium]KPH76995.1 RNA polymerase sigma factor SigD [Oceanobacillus caeni]MBU8790069.1 FliA/WhiG family RNA polymerase sigma factor [Oceanobacillus caeni]MCR1833228.1 FliA/WhiG family RNA polymerase sigma factor [Oceanobacillus caeni]
MYHNPSSLEQDLWNNWINDKNSKNANELIHHYEYLVHFHVERMCIHLPKSINKEDIKSLGFIGLYDALKKFEPNRDLKFDTYASIRIRGSIIDGLRKEDWLPRSLRDKVKKVDQATQSLEQKYQRSPNPEEIAKYSGLTVEEVENTIKDSLFSNILSIEEKSKTDYVQETGIGYSIADDSSQSPESKILQKELEKELKEGIKELNEKEQLVISLFYFDELSLTEIGQVLELTTSRISQIHKKAIVKLRKTLNKLKYLSHVNGQ